MICTGLVGFMLLSAGCARKVVAPVPAPSPVPVKSSPEPEKAAPPVTDKAPADPTESGDVTPPTPAPPSPRQLASLQLSEQGRRLLYEGRLDEAITMFERGVGLNPGNGELYYYLAEAWILKGDPDRATEFNRLAALYLNRDAGWMKRINEQKRSILKKR